MPVPALYFSAKTTTLEGVELSFGQVMAPLVPWIFLLFVALCFVDHTALPLLLALALPLFLLKNVWTFCYRGPRVRHEVQLFGVSVWRSEWTLNESDSASKDLIEDSIFLTVRPRWYKLNLWSVAGDRDHTIMRSNDLDELDRLVAMLNDTIKEVSAHAAS